jgi:hypothetical protein
MKKLTGLMIIALLPFMVLAQSKAVVDFQDKYSNHEDVTHVTIKGPLFSFLASLADYDDDPEAQAFARVADGIKSMDILQVPFYETDLNREEITSLRKSLQKDNYEELIMVKEGRELVNILAQGGEDEIRNMLILVEKKDEFTLLSINGKLSMKDISYLSKHHNNFH